MLRLATCLFNVAIGVCYQNKTGEFYLVFMMPAFENIGYPISIINFIANELQGQISVSNLIKNTGIQVEKLSQPDALISNQQEKIVFDNIYEQLRTPCWGLIAGEKMHLDLAQLGVYGYALMSAPSLRQAIQFVLWGKKLTGTTFHYTLEEKANNAYLSLTPKHDYQDSLLLRTDTEMSSVIQTITQLFRRRIPLKHVYLTHKKGAHSNMYHSFYNCPVLFDQRKNCIVFDAKYLDEPLIHGDKNTFEACQLSCQQLIEKKNNKKPPLSELIFLLLIEKKSHDLTLHDTAAKLKLSTRTLRRRLQEEGTNFQNLVRLCRMNQAKEKLINTQLTIEEIAFSLSYSDASAFTHAFKRWAGMPPSALRKNAD
mgnify:CR=1 FL=1